jgi:hypothetical protein
MRFPFGQRIGTPQKMSRAPPNPLFVYISNHADAAGFRNAIMGGIAHRVAGT